MIPEAAVEAALASFYAETEIGYLPSGIMRAILKSAAPHMLAEAWDAGHRTCRLDPDSIEFNPYKPTP